MQGFISAAQSSGASSKRFGSSFGSEIVSGSARGNTGGDIRQRFSTTGTALRPFEGGPTFHQEGSNSFAPPMHATEDVNPRVTVRGRRIMPFAAQRLGNADLGPPVQRQLAFVWRDRPSGESDSVNVRLRQGPNFLTSLYGAPQLNVQMPGNPSMKVQALPSLAAEPCALNYAWADMQRQWAETDPGAYRLLTEEMLYYGTGDLNGIYPSTIINRLKKLPGFSEYEGFDLDGIPRHTIAEDGTSPQYNDGIVRGHRDQRAAKAYTVAMTARGAEMCLDYWNAHGLDAGTLLYMIIKKSPIERYTHRAKSDTSETDHLQYLLYDLATKAHDQFRDGASMRREVKMPKLKNREGEEVFMTPFQVHFVSSRTTLDREHARYIDEFGYVRYGLVMYVGTVLHPPPSGSMKAVTALEECGPYMSNRHATQNEPFEIILNPDSGLRCAS